MTDMDGDKTAQCKLAFERYADSHNIKISHYHYDNGLFDIQVFKESIKKKYQTILFCGVNARHQNINPNNRIKDMTMNVRTALLHTAHRWPKTIHTSLWSVSLNYINFRDALPTHYVKGKKAGCKT